MGLPGLLLRALLLYLAYHTFCIYRNYARARTTGLPVRIQPFTPTSPAWLLIGPVVFGALDRIGLGRRLSLAYFGGEIREKFRPFVEQGSTAIALASPGKIWLSLADPVAIAALAAAERKGEITRPAGDLKMLDAFGPNIFTAQGADWQRMRRTTAASFNEGTSRVVWGETLRLGQQILEYWLSKGEQGVTSTSDDTQALTLNVLMFAAFGKAYDFQPTSKDESNNGGSMDHREALKLVLGNSILAVGVGPNILSRLGIFSSKLVRIGNAFTTFQRFMADMLSEGQKGQVPSSRGNLLASLVRATYEDKVLTAPEVYGNVFIYMFGGHDTTAHSLASTFVLLSIHPKIQESMREEIRRVLPGKDPKKWNYDDFGKLKRTLAIQYETVRLYNPVMGIVRATVGDRPIQLPFDGGKGTISIPERTVLAINLHAAMTDPRYWGADSLEWKPFRWIQRDSNGIEQLVTPEKAKGSFLAWSEGSMRACPGKKFAHAEHVALMAAVFHDHAVEPAAMPGETKQQTRVRVQHVADDFKVVLNMEMKHPERAGLVWKRCT